MNRVVREGMSDNSKIIIYGANAVLHDRIAEEKGSYERVLESIRTRQDAIYIPVFRYNFFHLAEIAARALEEAGEPKPDFSGIRFSPRPVSAIDRSFRTYFNAVRVRLRGTRVILGEPDHDLLSLLKTAARRSSTVREPVLLRSLGLLCETVFAGPMRLLIDPTPLCNLDCLYCRAHSHLRWEMNEYFRSTIKDPFLDFDLFKQVIDDAAEMGVEAISVVGGGDPTVHPKFTEMVEYISDKGNLEFNVSTNALKLNERIARAMCRLPSGSLTASISAASPETYVRLHPSRRRQHFERLIEKLKMFSDIRYAEQATQIKMKNLFVITTYNLHEIVEFLEMTRRLKFNEVWFQLVHIDPYCEFLQPSLEQKKQVEASILEAKKRARQYGIDINSYLDFQLQHLDEGGNWSRAYFLKHGCNVGWQFAYISYQGEVSFCCGLKVIDEIGEKSFRDIWFGSDYHRYRVAAKRLRDKGNAGIRFKNGKPLYDDFCDCCDNHNFNEEIMDQVRDSGLEGFLDAGRVQASPTMRSPVSEVMWQARRLQRYLKRGAFLSRR